MIVLIRIRDVAEEPLLNLQKAVDVPGRADGLDSGCSEGLGSQNENPHTLDTSTRTAGDRGVADRSKVSRDKR